MSNLTKEEVTEIVRAAVAETLFSLGLDASSKEEIAETRKDMAHLRKWRVSVDQVQSTTFFVAFGIIVTGIMGAVWLGFKIMIGQ